MRLAVRYVGSPVQHRSATATAPSSSPAIGVALAASQLGVDASQLVVDGGQRSMEAPEALRLHTVERKAAGDGLKATDIQSAGC